MKKRYSRLSKLEEKRDNRHALVLIGTSILIIVFLATFGFPLVTRVSEILISLNKSSASIDINDQTPPPPPRINTIVEYTNQKDVEISGVTEPGALVNIYFNEAKRELLAGSSGSFTANFILVDGENKVYAKAIDNNGNTSEATNTMVIHLDNEPPELEIQEPLENTTFYGNKQRQVVIKGKTETDTKITINDRVVVVENTGNFTFYTSLSEGNNEFRFKATDKAGNLTESKLNLNFSL
ncbi:hypothetical protein A2961_03980 [Candidatus Woesebacteria bacterium RIFCSPLOWO2_01_FULL_39_21]|uniref:Bacterial Ig-like domain-containing protein n=1 Tax=Candidatus Woesebacteria bacterium RIFCSPLOWO2_01_FULL_39_21 TaxID=1802519 RepID=A0A1F8BC20_9BACT|nr:MAG: hypothetical protein A2691_04115 [Candidatus Woesebacteria bacterium RIFCSPHIGHO2_01_FULL_39_23]OGM61591.1 MAG: hypothetical protein A2961_03980 [Candidatus Woesebacteria bacterium RIFCSPLOWO2_01_FULL_39_21]